MYVKYFLLPGILALIIIFLAGIRYGAYIEQANTRIPTPIISENPPLPTKEIALQTITLPSCGITFNIPDTATVEVASDSAAITLHEQKGRVYCMTAEAKSASPSGTLLSVTHKKTIIHILFEGSDELKRIINATLRI